MLSAWLSERSTALALSDSSADRARLWVLLLPGHSVLIDLVCVLRTLCSHEWIFFDEKVTPDPLPPADGAKGGIAVFVPYLRRICLAINGTPRQAAARDYVRSHIISIFFAFPRIVSWRSRWTLLGHVALQNPLECTCLSQRTVRSLARRDLPHQTASVVPRRSHFLSSPLHPSPTVRVHGDDG